MTKSYNDLPYIIPLDISNSVINNYKVKHKIGKGVFGNIYSCNNDNFVIKQYNYIHIFF